MIAADSKSVMPTAAATRIRSASAGSDAGSGGGAIARLRGVHKSFAALRVLAGVDIAFERGKTTVVLGPSGTGKSVMLKHLVGLLRPDKGEVYFQDQRVDQLGEHALVEIRRQIGFLFQMGALFDSRTVEENICFPLKEHTKLTPAEQRERCAAVLRMVGLDGVQRKMPADLSGGQRKRVALARAVVMQPQLILYDEPTTGLDPVTSDVINELIISLAKNLGISSVVVTHDMVSARKIADRMVLLHDGGVVADGAPAEFLKLPDPIVQRFVQGRADEQELAAIRKGFEGAA